MECKTNKQSQSCFAGCEPEKILVLEGLQESLTAHCRTVPWVQGSNRGAGSMIECEVAEFCGREAGVFK